MPTLDQLMAGDDGTRQIFMALAVPVAGMLSVRCIEAGFGLWVTMAFTAMALCTLLYREQLDAFFWAHVIGEDSSELFQLRSRRQQGRFEIAKKGMTVQLLCGVLFHASRLDHKGAAVPLVIACLLQLLKPEQGRFLAYFINGVPFNVLCFLRGGGPDENFLWSPVLILPLWNLLVIPSVSTHGGLELLRLAAVLHFCAIAELRLVVASTCVLMTVYRVLEGNYDMKLVVGCRTERRVNECVNLERKQLVGVLSHEARRGRGPGRVSVAGRVSVGRGWGGAGAVSRGSRAKVRARREDVGGRPWAKCVSATTKWRQGAPPTPVPLDGPPPYVTGAQPAGHSHQLDRREVR